VKRFAHIGRKWFYVATAKQKINSAQAELIDRLEQTLG
jgi:predicted NUDIX family NTP pyrophosphohydrolase